MAEQLRHHEEIAGGRDDINPTAEMRTLTERSRVFLSG